MSIDNIVHTISVVIANAAPVSSGTYELVVFEQKIYLRKRQPTNESYPVLARLESADINNRLPPGLWGFIKYRISDFLLRGILK